MKTTIYQNQTGLLIRQGRIVKVLPAGVYKTYGFRNETVIVYPTYSQAYAYVINVRTSEAAAVSIDVTVGVTIVNAEQLYTSGKTPYEIVNRTIASQLQDVATTRSLSELLEGKLSLDEGALRAATAEYGLEAKIELSPAIRLPRNLQNAIDAQEVARQRAKAELEEARGRSAVIRHYANVAKVTRDNPDLLRLLLGQKAKSINVAFDTASKEAK